MKYFREVFGYFRDFLISWNEKVAEYHVIKVQVSALRAEVIELRLKKEVLLASFSSTCIIAEARYVSRSFKVTNIYLQKQHAYWSRSS